MLYSTLEQLKVPHISDVLLGIHTLTIHIMSIQSQRDLYIAMRDLFIRHDRLSGDQVDRLRKRIETSSLKLESVKQAQKERWEIEADKIAGSIEKDQATVAALLNRRVFIRARYVSIVLPSYSYCSLRSLLSPLPSSTFGFSQKDFNVICLTGFFVLCFGTACGMNFVLCFIIGRIRSSRRL